MNLDPGEPATAYKKDLQGELENPSLKSTFWPSLSWWFCSKNNDPGLKTAYKLDPEDGAVTKAFEVIERNLFS
ncbi:hypothetical protein RchiOBHm_Chr2g0165341 [Rosa chinensis]|uniref:Uncharacterized protein n=1 Tax=Rosa chinensis TaxID=74649 RepID=A0A2P6S3S4_ROSCH|nr:hypothetical protein RchiOBHm_Chr2g0165341 [Rosa chinensis]